jgi:zinc and cadmium transporter
VVFPPIPFAIFAIAVISSIAGIWLTYLHSMSRRLVPFSGGILVGVAIFWMLPEMAEFFRWPLAIAWIATGAGVLALIDRFVYPVCPACSHSHEHAHCATRLHGFATPLLAAAALHSALDGWSAVTAQEGTRFGAALIFGIAAHKIPEGLALGVIARASLSSRSAALAWCVLAQSATLVGAALAVVIAPQMGNEGVHILLALAAGSFLYLGGHAVHGEWQRSGLGRAFVPALTGVAGSSVLRLFIR